MRHGGSRKTFLESAKLRGFDLNPSEVSNLQTGNKSFGENKAAEYEAAAGMPPGYLVKALDPVSQLQRLPTRIILRAIQLMREATNKVEGEAVDVEEDPELFAELLQLATLEPQEKADGKRGIREAGRPGGRAAGAAGKEEVGQAAGSADRRTRKRA